MELSWELKVLASPGSKKYAEQLKSGEMKVGQPFVKIGTGPGGDVIATAAPRAATVLAPAATKAVVGRRHGSRHDG